MIIFKLSVITIFFVYPSIEEKCSSSNKEKSRVQDVEELFREFWEWKLVNNPEFATRIGNFEYDDRVNEMSLSSYERRAS